MKKNAALWVSISILTGVEIAVIAFLRGTRLELPLLLGAAGVWLAWLCFTRILPAVRAARIRKAAEKQRKTAAATDTAQMQTLLRILLQHVNHRVSDCLRAAYQDVRWEWCMRDPAGFAARGGTGRIRVYGIPDYDYADVTLNQNGKLDCALVKVLPLDGAASQPASPNGQPSGPESWYETQGRSILERLVADLESRGYHGLTIKEDGSVCAHSVDGGGETTCASLASFPERTAWPALVKVLEAHGLAATAKTDGILVVW